MFQAQSNTATATIPSITVQEAWAKVSQPSATTMLIDVRETDEFARGHAQKATNIPLSQLETRITEIPTDQEILLICQSGHRSLKAATFLQEHGYSKVINVTGGTSMWKEQKLPME